MLNKLHAIHSGALPHFFFGLGTCGGTLDILNATSSSGSILVGSETQYQNSDLNSHITFLIFYLHWGDLLARGERKQPGS